LSYLLDTVVLSEMRKRQRDPNVLQWLHDKAPELLFVSAVTIGEIERGVEGQRRRNPVFAEALGSWVEQLIAVYEERILPVDIAVARRWGRLTSRLGHASADLLIAATALVHGLTVATRNVRDFAPAGVATENPFENAP